MGKFANGKTYEPSAQLVPLSVIFSTFFYIVFQVSAYRMLAMRICKYRITL